MNKIKCGSSANPTQIQGGSVLRWFVQNKSESECVRIAFELFLFRFASSKDFDKLVKELKMDFVWAGGATGRAAKCWWVGVRSCLADST